MPKSQPSWEDLLRELAEWELLDERDESAGSGTEPERGPSDAPEPRAPSTEAAASARGERRSS